MREILFRGKVNNPDNISWLQQSVGEWVEGNLEHDPDLESYKINGFNYYSSEQGLEREPFVYRVDPETVGQYTGMKDEYGRKIFEGDIVEFYFYNKTKHNHNGALIKTMLIEWFAGSFYMTELFRNYRLEEGPEIITEKIYTYRSSQTHGVYKSHCCYYAKLVGNKFDNPELLEGEENE